VFQSREKKVQARDRQVGENGHGAEKKVLADR
jgi:hypothetical protein